MKVADSVLPLIPVEFEIEFTNVCNAQCVACPRDQMPRFGYLDSEMLAQILNVRDAALEATPFLGTGLPAVTVAGGGEPFLNKDALRLLKQIRQRTAALDVITNASRIDRNVANALIDLQPRSIACSFWGIEQNEYENAMRLPFAETLANVEYLGSLAVSAGIELNINIVQVPELQSSLTQITAFWQHRGIKVASNDVQMWNRGGLLTSNRGYQPTGMSVLPDPSRSLWCSEIVASVAFSWNGECVLCCCNYFARRAVSLGQLPNLDWTTIAQRKREILSKRPLPSMCSVCELPRTAQALDLLSAVSDLIPVDVMRDVAYLNKDYSC